MKQLAILFLAACASNPAPKGETMPSHPPEHAHHAQHAHEGTHAHHEGNHRFAKAEEWAPMFDDPERDAWQMPDKIVAALALTPGLTAADIGAGTGYFEKRLSAGVGATGQVLAIDIEPDMVRYLRERAVREQTPNVEARLGTADDPKLGAASVDRILIVDTWHHVANRVEYGKRLATALKPGGFVLVVDFKLESERGPPKDHRVSADQVIQELARAGLTGAVVQIPLPDQYVVKATR